MNYADAVNRIWHPGDVIDDRHHLLALVRYATLAASSHNTQPWKFRIDPDRIAILPDLSRRCPEVDPDDHHLYASLGCATENLLWAAQAAGLRGHYSYDASSSSARVDLETAHVLRSSLFEAIPKRQCSRSEYDGAPLASNELRLVEKAASGDGVSVLLFTDARQKDQVAEYVAQGNAAQFADPRWAREMRQWIRFNPRAAVRTGDGLYGAVLGIPTLPQWLGKLIMCVATSAERQNRKDTAHIRSSSVIAVLFSEADDKPHWMEAGRCYERMALQAAALDLRTAFINQPVEVRALRSQFAASLGIGSRRPDLVVRIGHGPEMPRSLRRPVEQALV